VHPTSLGLPLASKRAALPLFPCYDYILWILSDKRPIQYEMSHELRLPFKKTPLLPF